MLTFHHVAPPLRLFSGRQSLGRLADELARIGSRRAVLFCGRTVERGPLLDQIKAAAGDRCAGTFAGVVAHSPLSSVLEAVDALRCVDADAIVAIGGGSAIVTARAAAIVLAEGRDLTSLATAVGADGRMVSPRLSAPKLPQLVVPTTPTTASVKAGTAVLDPAEGRRYALFDPKTRAQAVFVHPDFIAGTSRDLVTSSSLDTLALAIEGLLSSSGDPIANALLIHAVRLSASGLVGLATADTVASRAELVNAAILCGRGTDHTGAGAATALGHALGALCGVENGIAKAILLPHVIRFNGEAGRAGLRDVASALDMPRGTEPDAVVSRLSTIFQALEAPDRLRDIGVDRPVLGKVAQRAMGDWFLRGNPRPVHDIAEIETILAASW